VFTIEAANQKSRNGRENPVRSNKSRDSDKNEKSPSNSGTTTKEREMNSKTQAMTVARQREIRMQDACQKTRRPEDERLGQ
jgi:hypothetical protein